MGDGVVLAFPETIVVIIVIPLGVGVELAGIVGELEGVGSQTHGDSDGDGVGVCEGNQTHGL